MTGHGHVTPNPDGSRARCGGPAICADCAHELAALGTPPAPKPGIGWPETRAHRPERGSDVEAWLKAHRDAINPQAGTGDQAAWWALDDLLNDYRDRADVGADLTTDPATFGPNPETS